MKINTLSTQSIVILGGLMGCASLATDLYLPAMPQIAADLHGKVELTISGFLVGFALAQLLWGAISDKIGRKIPLYIGMLLFCIGSVGCALSQSMEQMVFWRVFQAVGASTGPMLSRAVVRDVYGQTEAAKLLSILMLIMAIVPIVAPLLGGQIMRLSTWHAVFWFQATLVALLFVALMLLPETYPTTQRTHPSLRQTFHHYWILLNNQPYLYYVACIGFYYLAVYAFVAGSPAVYIDYFGVSPQHYGWFFAANIIGVMSVSLANNRLLTYFSVNHILKAATLIAALAGSILMLCSFFHVGGLWAVVVCVFFFHSANGVVAACSTAGALTQVPTHMVGAASALLGAVQYGSGIFSALLLACFADGTPWTMSWIIGVFGLCSALTALSIKK